MFCGQCNKGGREIATIIPRHRFRPAMTFIAFGTNAVDRLPPCGRRRRRRKCVGLETHDVPRAIILITQYSADSEHLASTYFKRHNHREKIRTENGRSRSSMFAIRHYCCCCCRRLHPRPPFLPSDISVRPDSVSYTHLTLPTTPYV